MRTRACAWLLIGALPLAGISKESDNRNPPNGGQREPTSPPVKALDANGDGVIDSKEIARAAAALKALDKNGDGKLTQDELMPPRPGGAGGGGRPDAADGPNGNSKSSHSRNGSANRGGPGGTGPGQGGPEGMGPGEGGPGQGGPGGPASESASAKASGAFTVDGKALRSTAQTYTSTRDDVSAVYVCNGGSLTMASPKITTSGNTSSQDASSFHGLNAAVLAAAKSRVVIDGGWINTSGEGANGAFATGEGSEVRLRNVTVNAQGGGGHGVMATGGGTVVLSDVNIRTLREHGAALATDRGGGTILAQGGVCATAGEGSPGIYSTGRIVVSNAVFTSTGAEAAVIEGENTIELSECTLDSRRLCGVMLYQSFSGDAEGRNGRFAMRGGSLTASEGPLFRVTNAKGLIALSGAKVSAASGVLVKADAGRWGRAGSNGGHAVLTAEGETLDGNLICDEISAIDAALLKQTSLTGAVQGASVMLDATSTWSVTGDSSVKGLAVPGGTLTPVVAGIVGNGHTVTYDAKLDANAWLKGGTYPLANGGHLQPAKP